MEVKEFYQKLKKHCQQQSKGKGENCRQCCFRAFCFTPPISLSESLFDQTLNLLEKFQLGERSMADEIADLIVKIKVKIEVEDESDICACEKIREAENIEISNPLLENSKT